jgi:hypothetical protein
MIYNGVIFLIAPFFVKEIYMLNVNMITPEILEVEQVMMGFSSTDKTFFYTNINTWEDLTNPSASKQVGDFKVARKLCSASVEWIQKYHLPKLKRTL